MIGIAVKVRPGVYITARVIGDACPCAAHICAGGGRRSRREHKSRGTRRARRQIELAVTNRVRASIKTPIQPLITAKRLRLAGGKRSGPRDLPVIEQRFNKTIIPATP